MGRKYFLKGRRSRPRPSSDLTGLYTADGKGRWVGIGSIYVESRLPIFSLPPLKNRFTLNEAFAQALLSR